MLLPHFRDPFWFDFDLSSVLLMVAIPLFDYCKIIDIWQNPPSYLRLRTRELLPRNYPIHEIVSRVVFTVFMLWHHASTLNWEFLACLH